MKVAIGADHGGFELKEYLKKSCQDKGIEIVDLGTYSAESCDYPLIADKVAAEIIRGGADFGVLICHTRRGRFRRAYLRHRNRNFDCGQQTQRNQSRTAVQRCCCCFGQGT